jgi:hypothetical protein
MQGQPFKCDKVTSNPNSYLGINSRFTQEQVDVMMSNMQNLQAKQQS